MSSSFEPVPLGLHSPVLERARRLRERAGRLEASRFLIEGPTLLRDAVAAGRLPSVVYGTAEALAELGADLRAELRATPAYTVPPRAIERLSELETPPGVVAELAVELTEIRALFEDAAGAPLAVLAGIGDPGNAGTLLRSAEIFGIRHLAFADGGVEPYHPKVVRAAMGAHFRSVLALAAGDAILEAAAAAGYAVVAADADGEPLPNFDFPERVAIAVGSERRGVRAALRRWDRSVSVPQPGGGESLNAAIAGSIVFYSLSQQLASGV